MLLAHPLSLSRPFSYLSFLPKLVAGGHPAVPVWNYIIIRQNETRTVRSCGATGATWLTEPPGWGTSIEADRQLWQLLRLCPCELAVLHAVNVSESHDNIVVSFTCCLSVSMREKNRQRTQQVWQPEPETLSRKSSDLFWNKKIQILIVVCLVILKLINWSFCPPFFSFKVH